MTCAIDRNYEDLFINNVSEAIGMFEIELKSVRPVDVCHGAGVLEARDA